MAQNIKRKSATRNLVFKILGPNHAAYQGPPNVAVRDPAFPEAELNDSESEDSLDEDDREYANEEVLGVVGDEGMPNGVQVGETNGSPLILEKDNPG